MPPQTTTRTARSIINNQNTNRNENDDIGNQRENRKSRHQSVTSKTKNGHAEDEREDGTTMKNDVAAKSHNEKAVKVVSPSQTNEEDNNDSEDVSPLVHLKDQNRAKRADATTQPSKHSRKRKLGMFEDETTTNRAKQGKSSAAKKQPTKQQPQHTAAITSSSLSSSPSKKMKVTSTTRPTPTRARSARLSSVVSHVWNPNEKGEMAIKLEKAATSTKKPTKTKSSTATNKATKRHTDPTEKKTSTTAPTSSPSISKISKKSAKRTKQSTTTTTKNQQPPVEKKSVTRAKNEETSATKKEPYGKALATEKTEIQKGQLKEKKQARKPPESKKQVEASPNSLSSKTSKTTQNEAAKKEKKVVDFDFDNKKGSSGSTKPDEKPVKRTRAKKVEKRDVLAKTQKTTDKEEEEDDEEAAACCLCHCGLDCSDRALFFKDDREREIAECDADSDVEDYYFKLDDPYLDEGLYDKHNALVYCDSCDRLYHQKCHFAPLLVIPRGNWECLLCTYQKEVKKQQQQRRKKLAASKANTGSKKKYHPDLNEMDDSALVEWTPQQFAKMFVLPPPTSSPSRQRIVTTAATGSDAALSASSSTAITNEVSEWQTKFEWASRDVKANLLDQQFKQVEKYLSSQSVTIRQGVETLETLMSTKRNRQHFMQGTSQYSKTSQELAQNLVRITTAKLRVKECFQSLESIRASTSSSPAPDVFGVLSRAKASSNGELPEQTRNESTVIQEWCHKSPKLAQHVFPYGVSSFVSRKRHVPRTREMKQVQERRESESKESDVANKWDGVPVEVIVPSNTPCKAKCTVATSKPSARTAESDKVKQTANGEANDKDHDDDSGISLDDLQCCVCLIGDATDDNDVLLCDGDGCFRAYHMKCVRPVLTTKELSQDDYENWFCPICYALGNLIPRVQTSYMGDEWEHRRREEGRDDTSSLKSWVHVKDVFPDAEWEYETALKLKKGKVNAETRKLMVRYLGEDFDSQKKKKKRPEPQSDDEDEEDYSLFDEGSFEERKRKEREAEAVAAKEIVGGEDDDDDDDSLSTRSSQATLVEMSSVELNIGKAELDALSSGEDDNSCSDGDDSDSQGSNDEGGPRRRSRRLKKMYDEDSDSYDLRDRNGADFDESNIIEGKRRRKRVDYVKLNSALFGDLDEEEKAEIDDKDDFKLKKKTKSKASSGDDDNPRKRRKTVSDSSKVNPDSQADKEEDSDDTNNSDDGSDSGENDEDSDSNDSDAEDGSSAGDDSDEDNKAE